MIAFQIYCHRIFIPTLRLILLIGCFVFIAQLSNAQEQKNSKYDRLDSLYQELDLLFAESDSSLYVLNLVDSLLAAEKIRFHAAMFRVAYLSQVTSAGRSQDVNQFGLSSGLSYFHPSGIYADVNGFYNSSYDPGYFLTALSTGFFDTFYQHWNFNISHDFYFYNDTLSSQPFNYAANISNYLSYQYFDAGIDYAYLYGNQAAHRLSISANFKKRWSFNGLLKSITVMPGSTVQWGNASIIYYKQSDNPAIDLRQIINQQEYPNLMLRQYLYLTKLLQEERYDASYLYLRRNGYTNEQISSVLNSFLDNNLREDHVFGLMNYALQMPVSLNFKHFSVMLNYTHNFPIALPNETIQYEKNGFLSASISYIFFKPQGFNFINQKGTPY